MEIIVKLMFIKGGNNMDINDIKNGNFSQKDVEEACKEIDNESIYDFMHSLTRVVEERESKNKGYFIGWCEEAVSDYSIRNCTRLGNCITEAEAKSRLYNWIEEFDNCIYDSGYVQVDEAIYDKCKLYKILDDLHFMTDGKYAAVKDAPESLRVSVKEYMDRLYEELTANGLEFNEFLDDYEGLTD